LKRYEKESLFKNFLVFFSLLEILLILLFLELYHTEKKEYRQNLYKTMQLCSYTLECEQFSFDFAPSDKNKLNELYEDGGLYSYFAIPKSKKFYMKISYPQKNVLADMKKLRQSYILFFILVSLLLFGIALFFTFYSLKPIRKALQLNDEFMKDILHDFNTPITSMVLNIKMFEEEKGKDPFIQRVSHSIDNILLLQNNLKSFLHQSPSQNQEIDIASLTRQRLLFMQNIYPKIHFNFEKKNNLVKISNEELFTRILDNILSNAAKYNKPQGDVNVTVEGTTISIQDTGKGIEHPEKIFDRYYTEQERGLGLGLHIVRKLTMELHIELEIISHISVGTRFILELKNLREVG